MPSCTFEFKMPLFVVQQLLRHRTAKLNQESHRYSEVSEDKQETQPDEWRLQSTNNKQGSDGFLSNDVGIQLTQDEDFLHEHCISVYNRRLELGVSREQARKDIPHSTYSKLYWQSDLRNLLHFMGLRCDSHAQLEIRVYANIIASFVKELFPISFEAWYDYAFQASNFTRLDKMLLQKEFSMVESYDEGVLKEYAKSIEMSDREFGEYKDKTSLPTAQDFDLSNWELYEYE